MIDAVAAVGAVPNGGRRADWARHAGAAMKPTAFCPSKCVAACLESNGAGAAPRPER